MNIKNGFRIKEIIYKNKQTLFFCQELKRPFLFSFKRKWIDIMNTSGYETLDSAKYDLKKYIHFYNSKLYNNKISYYYMNDKWYDEINE